MNAKIRYVVAFWHNEELICLKCANNQEEMEIGAKIETPVYYVVTFRDGDVKRIELEDNMVAEIGHEIEWIPTSPSPPGAVFPSV